jgi:RTX calcium-binding nonapeptide repeat (4 copies)
MACHHDTMPPRGRCTAARRALPVGAAVLLIVLVPLAGIVYGKASHEGWPDTVVYKSHAKDQDGVIDGTNRSDELLGGHGNDTIYGGGSADVIWGDFKPCCQPETQQDRLYGGPGKDFIYTSHGFNDVTGGAGNDTVHAHFGRGGTVDCGTGSDLLFVSHRSKPHYRIRHCERISFKHEGK